MNLRVLYALLFSGAVIGSVVLCFAHRTYEEAVREQIIHEEPFDEWPPYWYTAQARLTQVDGAEGM